MDARRRLLDAMRRCLATTPIDNLKVGEIVAVADVSRQTFYRQYDDKFDLLEDFYKTEIVSLYDDLHSPRAVYDGTCKTLEYLQSHQSIARNMFFSKDMFALESFFRDLCCEIDMELWRAQGANVDDERVAGAIRLYAYGTTVFLMKWIKEGCPGDLDTVVAQFALAIPVGVFDDETIERLTGRYYV